MKIAVESIKKTWAQTAMISKQDDFSGFRSKGQQSQSDKADLTETRVVYNIPKMATDTEAIDHLTHASDMHRQDTVGFKHLKSSSPRPPPLSSLINR